MIAANYRDPLPGVPAVESPFFDELFDKADPRFPIARALRETGYAVIDFPEPDLDAIADRIKRALHHIYPWDEWQAGRGDMRYMDAWRFNADVRQLAVNEGVRELLSYLYGRTAFPFQTLNFPVGTEQHYHSDAAHFSSRPERYMCGVWIALEDISADQGPLLYYPGSHKWPIYTREHIARGYNVETGSHQRAFEPLWERLVDIHDAAPERFFPRKGQALIWAANLLHGGDHHSNRAATRWSQVTHYYFEDCTYYTPLGSNEPAGEILHRTPIDIASGAEKHPTYLGEKVDHEFIAATMSGRKLPTGFDDAQYLALNPDVAAAGMDARVHYRDYGRAEGRRWRD